MSGLEPHITRVLTQVGQKLFGSVNNRRIRRYIRGSARTLVAPAVAEALLAELDEATAHRLYGYLSSPDFEEVALQYLLGRQLHDVPPEELAVNIRHEIRLGLRHHVGLSADVLTTAADVVFDAVTIGAHEELMWATGRETTPAMTAAAAHLTAAAAANSQLLQEVAGLAEVHEFARLLRAQVVAVHRHMKLPQLGATRSVPYDQLYVPPTLLPEHSGRDAPDHAALALPGQRSVILGDPGAGKSTLAAKLAHDVAAGLVPGAEGRVPFLLVLRDFTGSFREGGKQLAHYLEQVCRDPYNLEPPEHAVEYLLRNGRALVLLDGLDELVEPALRRKVVQLVDGFVNRFPLVPVLVTARRVGYGDAPLDRDLFRVGAIAEFSDDQVERYAGLWFALDERVAEAKRPRLASSFVAESGRIAELRRNPLLLALLCAMYSSEHYIPTNLAQVYERCAVMLFDQWDVQRGLADAPQFHGRLRTAVQHLAWQLFTADESGKALPRHRIVRLLARHFVDKGFHEDDAVSTAEQFVTFCTGRAWVLTDVGATEVEPRYGFTHRTFLEYFAAEHLVRTHPAPELLWAALRSHVLAGGWEVIAQIALQLLDRNMDGGADAVLRLVLAETTDELTLHRFAAQALGHVHPTHDVIAAVVAAALRDALSVPCADLHVFWLDAGDLKSQDLALRTLTQCSPGNRLSVRRALVESLGNLVAAGNDEANLLLLDSLTHTDEGWADAKAEMETRHATAVTSWRAGSVWASVGTTAPDDVVRRFGPEPLYLARPSRYQFSTAVERVLMTAVADDDPPDHRTELCAALLAAPRPWITDRRWWDQLHATKFSWTMDIIGLIRGAAWTTAPIVPLTLLFLPYLETLVRLREQRLPDVPLITELWIARVNGDVREELAEMFAAPTFPDDVAAFLTSWVRREFDVVHA